MKLIEIQQNGALPEEVQLDEYLRMVIAMTVELYEKVGFVRPWISYLAVQNFRPVGTCAFKSPPLGDRVEIAYSTLPGFEGQGIATSMARELVRIAQQEIQGVKVFAQTLPAESASTTILKKLGFQLLGSVEHREDGTVWEWEL